MSIKFNVRRLTNISEDYTNMSPEDYIKNRLEDQISWYDKKSIDAQKKYKCFQRAEIIMAAAIPFLSGFASTHPVVPVIISLLGTLVVISASMSRLGKYHENWLEYRATCELLRHEKYLYLTGTNPYEDKSFQLLVERVESMISAENINWAQLATTTNDKQ